MAIPREIFFITSTVALVYSGLTMIFPILPFYLEQFGGGATEFGFAASSFALAIFIFAPVAGRIADQNSKKSVIAGSLVGYGLVNFIFVFVNSTEQIIALRFLEGIFTAGVAPAAISIASDLSDETYRARSIAFVTAGISFGIIVGPLIGGSLILILPLYVPFLVSGALGLISAVTAYKKIREPQPESQQEGDEHISRIQKLPKPLISLIAFLLIQFILSFSWLLIEPGFVFYFYNQLGYNSFQFGIFVASYGAFVFFGEVVLGGISDKFGRLRIYFVGAVINAAFYLVLSTATSLLVLVVSASIAGVALGLIGPALNALLSEVTLPKHRTYVFGISTSFAGLAQISGPLLGGWAIDQQFIDIRDIALFSSFISTIAVALVLLLRFEKPNTRDKYLISPSEMTQTDL